MRTLRRSLRSFNVGHLFDINVLVVVGEEVMRADIKLEDSGESVALMDPLLISDAQATEVS
jgi:hypothetical protein